MSTFFHSFLLDPKAIEIDLQMKSKYLNTHCLTLSRFLNDQGVSGGVISFPDDLIKENGALLIKLLEFFGPPINMNVLKQDSLLESSVPPNDTSKTNQMTSHSKDKSRINHSNKISFAPGTGSSQNLQLGIYKESFQDLNSNNQYVWKLQGWYMKVLNYLKTFGLLLNCLRPEFLMSYADLVAFWKLNDSKNVFIKKYKISPQQHEFLSKFSWCALFFQIIKGNPFLSLSICIFKCQSFFFDLINC